MRSAGEWLLLVDADIILDSTAVDSALEFAEAHNLDALSLLPEVTMKSWWEYVVMPANSWLSLMRVTTTLANGPWSRFCFGSGSFILVRRTAHDAIGGFGRYRSHILDDCIVMELLKRAGFKVMVCFASDLLRTRMYSSLREIVNGCTKNAFAALHNSLLFLAVVVVWQIATVFFPLFILAGHVLGKQAGSAGLAAIAALPMFLTMAIFGADFKASLIFYVLYPLGLLVCLFILVRSAYRHVGNRPIAWRGRFVGRDNNAPGLG